VTLDDEMFACWLDTRGYANALVVLNAISNIKGKSGNARSEFFIVLPILYLDSAKESDFFYLSKKRGFVPDSLFFLLHL
jgi:hypothetical protein